MRILAIECSAKPCSVAIIEDDKILASAFTNVGLTHSQTLMPMVEDALKRSLIDIGDIEGFAVSAGPGSFTGIRIGISAVKGMAASRKVPCAEISTLRAMAENYIDTDCIVCAVMDARCAQVYNALFDVENGEVKRLCDDRALMCDDLKTEIENLSSNGKKIVIVGDGTDVFYPFVKDIPNVNLSHESRRYQNAVGIGFAALDKFSQNDVKNPEDLLPVYLRLPQAERELKLKKEQKL